MPAVVVVNYGSHELLRANLAPGAADVVVVDNFSDTGERRAIRALSRERNWRLVELDDNRGFGAGVNAGVAAARDAGAHRFVVINPDAVVSADVVAALDDALTVDSWSVLAPRIVASNGANFFDGAEVDLRSGRVVRVPGSSGPAAWLSGACLAFSAVVFDAVGGFDEQFFLYWEDVDFSFAARRAGARLVVREDLVVVHDEGGTQGRTRPAEQPSRAKSALYYHYNCRNRLLFGARHLPPRQLARWMLRTPTESRQILLRGGRRQLLHSPRPLWATLSGSIAGLRVAAAVLWRARRGMRRDEPDPRSSSRAH